MPIADSAPARPRRSALYLPANNPRALAKARTLPCDAVILDLEDSVAPDAKADARDQLARALAEGGFGRREVVVRVNGLDTPWGEADLDLLERIAPDAVLVPKVNEAGDLARYDARLSRAPERVRLWTMIETCRSLFHLCAIAGGSGSTRLACLVVGTNDLAKEMGAALPPDGPADRSPFHTALSLTVAAARANGLGALDGVFNALDDAAGFERECAQGKAFGFDGKTLIHPAQIDSCNRAFTPSAARVAWARSVADAFARPENQGAGVLRVDGEMVERLHLAQAEQVLAMAEAVA